MLILGLIVHIENYFILILLPSKIQTMILGTSTIIEPHEPFAFFQTDSLKSETLPQVCDLHEQFGTASAKIHDFLDPDG